MSVNKDDLVVKGNELIQASYHLAMVEQRIILLAIAEIRKMNRVLRPDELIVVKATDYIEMFGVSSSNAYPQIKEASITLLSKKFRIHGICKITGKPDSGFRNWLQEAIYVDEAGIIKLLFTVNVLPYITMLEGYFTPYKIKQVAKMTSIYAIRLYELLIQWQTTGVRDVEIAWLKKTFLIEDEYANRIDLFKKRVIDIAVAQINEHSDLTCSYEQRKTGRTVTHLIFTFSKKPEEKPAKPAKDANPTPISTEPPATATRAKKQVKTAIPAKQETTMTKPLEEGMVRCGRCGQALREDVRVCPHCSEPHVPKVSPIARQAVAEAKKALNKGKLETPVAPPTPKATSTLTDSDAERRARIEAQVAAWRANNGYE